MDLARTLSYNYVFRGLPREVVAGFAALATLKKYMGGDVIVRQFDANSDLFVLLDGEARIKSFSGETIAEFGPGSIIGEISLIDEGQRSATVAAIGAVELAVIPAAAIRDMMAIDPTISSVIATNICKVLCRRLRSMNVHVDAIAGKENSGALRH